MVRGNFIGFSSLACLDMDRKAMSEPRSGHANFTRAPHDVLISPQNEARPRPMEREKTSKRGGMVRSIAIAVLGLTAGALLARWVLGRVDCSIAYTLVVSALPLV